MIRSPVTMGPRAAPYPGLLRSPWDGHGRAPLRVVLAATLAFDASIVAHFVGSRAPSSISHAQAPVWLLYPGGRPAIAILITAATLLAAARFASRPRAWGAGLALLAGVGVLNESLAAIYEGPMRAFFSSGAALAGWIAGLLYAEALGGEAREPRRAEALAEIGASAGLAATYVGAVASKLLKQGFSWADAASLQGLIVSQQPLDRAPILEAYSSFVAAHAPVALAFAAITLLAQASMAAYPFSPRARIIGGSLTLAFHVNVALLTPIFFVSPVILLAALSYPWPRIVARLRGRPASADAPPDAPAADLAPGRAGRVAMAALAITTAMVLVAWLSPLRDYTLLHHGGHQPAAPRPRDDTPPPPPPPPPAVDALLDHLRPGDRLASLQVKRIDQSDGREIRIELDGGEGASMRAAVTRRGARGFPAPRSTDTYEIFYDALRGIDDARRDAALEALESRLRHTEHAVPTPEGM